MKFAKTRFEWIEHGFKISSRQAIDIARKTIVEKQILETFFEALKHFSEYEKLNDLQFKDDLEQFWIQETLKFI